MVTSKSRMSIWGFTVETGLGSWLDEETEIAPAEPDTQVGATDAEVAGAAK